MLPRRAAAAVLTLLVCLTAGGRSAADTPELTKEEMASFLLTAQVVESRPIGRGVTRPWRLTLTDGRLTLDAAFNSVDHRAGMQRFGGGRTELHFVDSYHYNIAAYYVAELVGLDHMMPVTVERRWQGKTGSLSWWIESAMDEETRLRDAITPPDPEAWSHQVYRMRVFEQLVYDTDRNLGNILITPDWKVWMIDFTRAFRRWPDLRSPETLLRCDRQLLDRLRQLTAEQVRKAVGRHLSRWEVEALLERRDKLVSHFEHRIAELGEHNVLY